MYPEEGYIERVLKEAQINKKVIKYTKTNQIFVAISVILHQIFKATFIIPNKVPKP